MASAGQFAVRALKVADVDRYLHLTRRVDADSGVNGAPHSHPYERGETFDIDDARLHELMRWTAPTTGVGWRRAWGLFDGKVMVGSLYLAGGALGSETHRASLGMGILSSHHRRGGGSLLLTTAITWAREQPNLAWIDLGVFGDNPGAHALYTRHGFHDTGRTVDRFRVDGESLEDIQMTLSVT